MRKGAGVGTLRKGVSGIGLYMYIITYVTKHTKEIDAGGQDMNSLDLMKEIKAYHKPR